jgi:hypothetical protein
LCGLLTSALLAWVWIPSEMLPVTHDEAAYLLQAQIFASGHWTAPGRPLPEFFQQMHVFVTPVLAAKYPPGHSLFLAGGAGAGLPAAIPLLSGGLCAVLIVAVARRLAGLGVALLTWLIWILSPGALMFHPSYHSQTTSTLLMLSIWGALARWRATGARHWLFAGSACAAWGLLTRPFTVLALLIPAAAVVLCGPRPKWRDVAAALLVALPILAVIPLWSARTTGSWRLPPYALYSRLYFPYEKPGFGLGEEPSAPNLPADFQEFDRAFRQLHREHTLSRLPEIFAARAGALTKSVWDEGRFVLAPLCVVGVVAGGAAGVFAGISVAALLLFYLVYAHAASWTVYSLEVFPLLAFLSAFGFEILLRLAGKSSVRRWGLALACASILVSGAPRVALERSAKKMEADSLLAFSEAVARLPGPAIVFVRYSPEHVVHHSLVRNVPEMERASVWIVYDRGSENAKLRALAPYRRAFLWDERHGRLLELPDSI